MNADDTPRVAGYRSRIWGKAVAALGLLAISTLSAVVTGCWFAALTAALALGLAVGTIRDLLVWGKR